MYVCVTEQICAPVCVVRERNFYSFACMPSCKYDFYLLGFATETIDNNRQRGAGALKRDSGSLLNNFLLSL